MQEITTIVGLCLLALLGIGLRFPAWFISFALLIRPALDLLSRTALLPPLTTRVYLPSDALTPTGALAILVLLLGGYHTWSNRVKAWQSRIVRAYVVLLGLGVFSLGYSIGKLTSLANLAALGSIVAFIVLVDSVVQRPQNSQLVVWAIVLSSIIPVSMALYQLGHGAWESPYRLVKGSFMNVNAFGYFLFAFIGLGIGLFSRLKLLTIRIVLFVYLSLCGGLLLFTRTRGAWLALAVCVCVYALFIRSTKPALLVLLVGLLLGGSFWSLVQTRFFVPERRLRVWNHLLHVGAERPILGHGFGTAMDIAERAPERAYRMAPHNDFVRVFVELGAVGLVAFFYFLYSATREGLETLHRTKTRETRSMVAAFLGLFAGYIVASLVDNQLMNISMLWPMWTVFALARASVAESEQGSGRGLH